MIRDTRFPSTYSGGCHPHLEIAIRPTNVSQLTSKINSQLPVLGSFKSGFRNSEVNIETLLDMYPKGHFRQGFKVQGPMKQSNPVGWEP